MSNTQYISGSGGTDGRHVPHYAYGRAAPPDWAHDGHTLRESPRTAPSQSQPHIGTAAVKGARGEYDATHAPLTEMTLGRFGSVEIPGDAQPLLSQDQALQLWGIAGPLVGVIECVDTEQAAGVMAPPTLYLFRLGSNHVLLTRNLVENRYYSGGKAPLTRKQLMVISAQEAELGRSELAAMGECAADDNRVAPRQIVVSTSDEGGVMITGITDYGAPQVTRLTLGGPPSTYSFDQAVAVQERPLTSDRQTALFPYYGMQ